MSNNQPTTIANPAKQPEQSKQPKFETWLSVYRIFMSIADTVFELPEGINQDQAHEIINHCVESLYTVHEGDPAWDFAYERWIEPSDDDEEV